MGGFSPTDALQAIQAVLADTNIPPAQRLAIVRIITWARNGTGMAWGSYRAITRGTGLSSATISSAMKYAEGRYLHRHARGEKGAIQYKVALQSVKRKSTSSASKSKAQTPSSASKSKVPALQVSTSCASMSKDNLTTIALRVAKVNGTNMPMSLA